jgi:hypothetical protein
MKSPFPGMDPFIEASGLWPDFHGHLVHKIAEKIADALPPRYFVRTAERAYLILVEEEGKVEHAFLPDVSISTPRANKQSKKVTRKPSGSAVAEVENDPEPFILRAFIEEEHRETFLEIYEAVQDQRLVTSVEVLSPSNKKKDSEGRHLYLRKRQSHLLGDVNLIEIDLLRGGERMPMLDQWPDSPFTLMVAKARKPQLCRVWPAHFHKRLPVIPVPLLKPDAELKLDLQPLIDEIYLRYRYGPSIDYSQQLAPPLISEHKVWLDKLLKGRTIK